MSVLLKGFLILSFFCIITNSGNAQSNTLLSQNLSYVNIDEVADAEIKIYFSKATENGISEQNLYRVLQEKGLPITEIEKLKDRISIIQGGESKQNQVSKDGPSTNPEPVKRKLNQDATLVPMQKMQYDLSIFGSELFTETSMVFEPNLRIATPAGYILGPDDELIINVFGFSEKTYKITVNEEGYIYIPQVGPVYVTGLSIEQASGKIKAKLAATIYKAINGGGTSVQISLGKIKSIRVTIIGEAKNPALIPFHRLPHCLIYCIYVAAHLIWEVIAI